MLPNYQYAVAQREVLARIICDRRIKLGVADGDTRRRRKAPEPAANRGTFAL
jgi:hypothetical protein